MVYFLLSAFLIGSIIGSFNNVLIRRLVKDEKITGRSYCPGCHKKLLWYDLIPLVSFLLLGGKCRFCKKRISFLYPLVEFLTALSFSFFTYWFLTNLNSVYGLFNIISFIFWLYIISVLIVVFFTDWLYGIIPDEIVFPSIVTAFIYKLIEASFFVFSTYFSLKNSSSPLAKYLLPPYSNYIYQVLERNLTPFLSAFLAALGIALFFYLLIVLTKGRAMGGGDVKFGFLLGLLIGWPLVLVSLFIAFLTGAFLSVLLIIVRKKRFGQTIPFGPFLALSAFISLVFGQEIFNWYINILRR